jgi:hypothetical protein
MRIDMKGNNRTKEGIIVHQFEREEEKKDGNSVTFFSFLLSSSSKIHIISL